MTRLSLAARNQLAQDTAVTSLLASSTSWDTWIFDEKPIMVNFENNGKCLIVINEGDPWTSPNDHNRLYFTTLVVDIWADPDRRADKTILRENAKQKVLDIQRAVDRNFHVVGGIPNGWLIWGTPEQVAEKTGVYVSGSKLVSGPSFYDIENTEKAVMGRLVYGVNLA